MATEMPAPFFISARRIPWIWEHASDCVRLEWLMATWTFFLVHAEPPQLVTGFRNNSKGFFQLIEILLTIESLGIGFHLPITPVQIGRSIHLCHLAGVDWRAWVEGLHARSSSQP